MVVVYRKSPAIFCRRITNRAQAVLLGEQRFISLNRDTIFSAITAATLRLCILLGMVFCPPCRSRAVFLSVPSPPITHSLTFFFLGLHHLQVRTFHPLPNILHWVPDIEIPAIQLPEEQPTIA